MRIDCNKGYIFIAENRGFFGKSVFFMGYLSAVSISIFQLVGIFIKEKDKKSMCLDNLAQGVFDGLEFE